LTPVEVVLELDEEWDGDRYKGQTVLMMRKGGGLKAGCTNPEGITCPSIPWVLTRRDERCWKAVVLSELEGEWFMEKLVEIGRD